MSQSIKSKIDQYVVDYVTKLRKTEGLNQEDIATIIGAKRTFITNIEDPGNRAKYNLKHIDMLADHFGLSPRDFLPKEPLSKAIPSKDKKG